MISIANHARADGSGAWPSLEQMAREAGLSIREVRYSLRKAEALGELVTHVAEGPRGTNLYDLPLVNHPPAKSAGGNLEQDPRQNLSYTPAKFAPEPSLTVKEPSSTKSSKPEDLISVWNQNRGPMVACQRISAGRRQVASVRLHETPDLEVWAEAVRRASKSAFCTGQVEPRNGHRRFVGNIDWFLRPETLAKIEEGFYDDDRLARKAPKTFAEYLEASGTTPGAER